MKCRHCHSHIEHKFIDLGSSPPSNAYLSMEGLSAPETYFPLRVLVCTACWLVQTEDFARADELFSGDYAYFSSVSHTWLKHAADYTEMIRARLALTSNSFVIEIASNDGYLLKNFLSSGIPCLGVEPTANTAVESLKLGIPVIQEFFGTRLGNLLRAQGRQADLIVGNNVYAHVPDVNDFTAGLKSALKPAGVITLEFPHIMRLIEYVQFDTIYHEHFSYFSLHTVARIFDKAGLRVWDVEELPTHGGSLRVYGCHAEDPRKDTTSASHILTEEASRGLKSLSVYLGFQSRANRIKDDLVDFLIQKKRAGKTVAAYGAAAKGNTLLNYAGVRPDLISFVCDAAPSKQGKSLPGTRIPVLPPGELQLRRPNFVLILPWNLTEEVIEQLAYIREWGARFVVAVPEMREIA